MVVGILGEPPRVVPRRRRRLQRRRGVLLLRRVLLLLLLCRRLLMKGLGNNRFSLFLVFFLLLLERSRSSSGRRGRVDFVVLLFDEVLDGRRDDGCDDLEEASFDIELGLGGVAVDGVRQMRVEGIADFGVLGLCLGEAHQLAVVGEVDVEAPGVLAERQLDDGHDLLGTSVRPGQIEVAPILQLKDRHRTAPRRRRLGAPHLLRRHRLELLQALLRRRTCS
mmetsp:Transcript_13424/g.43744  ORF Transcript_13424/g.43744 Transcript_13424/m.43744 type:complete len:222 (+) Transcript_13424:789-1454(+)